MLHTLSNMPNYDVLQRCLDLIELQENSVLLLYQDAVYLAIDGETQYSAQIRSLAAKQKVYLLAEDLSARGLANKIIDQIILASYADFVALTIQHNKTLSW